MSQPSKVVLDPYDNGLTFWCPGCDCEHRIVYGDKDGTRWWWNSSEDKPTIEPSILRQHTKATAKGHEQMSQWLSDGCPARHEPFDTVKVVCHSFVTDGKIQFLSDCTHALAGQTVDLPDWDPLYGVSTLA